MIKIGIIGAEGRMGKQLLTEVINADDLTLKSAITYEKSPLIQTAVADLIKCQTDIKLTDNILDNIKDIDVFIDFSTHQATLNNLEKIKPFGTPIVIGTTGFNEDELAKLKAYGKDIPILQAANMSLGVNLVYALLDKATKALGKDADIEVLEMHHRYKKDAPSGTALEMGKVIAKALDKNFTDIAVFDRHDMNKARDKNEIGFASLRGGSVIGDHTVFFALDDEQIEITHKAKDRGLFAKGALYAARWLNGKKPGFYSMQDTFDF